MTFKELVKTLQISLVEAGEDLKVDGYFGPNTEKALSKFNVELILKPSGDSTKPIRDLSPAIKIIKEFEGLYLKAYKDPIGVPTIGWGTIIYPDGDPVRIGDSITKERAEELLLWEVNGFEKSVEHLVTRQISNNAFCALVSFCYNLGSGALQKSTLLKRLNAGDDLTEVAWEFKKWVNAGGKPFNGLIRRREAEAVLFLS